MGTFTSSNHRSRGSGRYNVFLRSNLRSHVSVTKSDLNNDKDSSRGFPVTSRLLEISSSKHCWEISSQFRPTAANRVFARHIRFPAVRIKYFFHLEDLNVRWVHEKFSRIAHRIGRVSAKPKMRRQKLFTLERGSSRGLSTVIRTAVPCNRYTKMAVFGTGRNLCIR